MIRRFIGATLVAVLLMPSSAFAQEKTDVKNIGGFTVKGNYYVDANVPMNSREQKLFLDVVDFLNQNLKKLPETVGYMPNISGSSLLSVKISKGGTILVNLDKTLVSGPGGVSAEVEDFMELLATGVSEMARKKMKLKGGVLITIEGQDVGDFDVIKPEVIKPQGELSPSGISFKSLAISAGHGLYYHYKWKDWRAQRDPFYGVLEDDITQELAATLQWQVMNRSADVVYQMRASSSAGTHGPSNQPWWRISSRYVLEYSYPTMPELWNTYSVKYPLEGQRERKDDINARPLYANFLNADYMVSIHTNAAPTQPNTGQTGTRVYFRDVANNRKLAETISCYMSEKIHARDLYKNFYVAPPEPRLNLAELNLAKMPTALVEVAYHDYPNDAAALKDPQFRLAAMNGIEKGVRLFQAGVGCVPFKLIKAPDGLGVPVGDEGTLGGFIYTGWAQYPIQRVTEVLSCGTTDCSGVAVTRTHSTYSKMLPDGSFEISVRYYCGRSNGSSTSATWITTPHRLRTYLQDADGVKTNAVDWTLNCLRPATSTLSKSDDSIGEYVGDSEPVTLQ